MQWKTGLQGQSVLLYGWGVTGRSAQQALQDEVGHMALYLDEEPKDSSLRDALRALRLPLYTGTEAVDEALQGVDFLIKSPGIRRDRPLLLEAKRRGIPCWSDLEVAFRLLGGARMIAITGSNGKTTTTKLLTHLLQSAGKKAVAVGNIGEGILSCAKAAEEDGWLVIECSSFQLANVETFAPHRAAILNLTPDHLGWHGSMEDYVACKAAIGTHQRSSDLLVLNPEDAWTKSLVEQGVFSSTIHWIDRESHWAQRLRNEADLWHLRGEHNIKNALSALALAESMGLSEEVLARGLSSFRAVAHRMEEVGVVDGVRYINDSKATNVDATVKALQGMKEPVLLLAGGMDKHIPFDAFYRAFAPVGKALFLFGETKHQIEAGAKAFGISQPVVVVDTLEEALRAARKQASPGDVVLLSPASASWDMYDSFEQRGEEFRELVESFHHER